MFGHRFFPKLALGTIHHKIKKLYVPCSGDHVVRLEPQRGNGVEVLVTCQYQVNSKVAQATLGRLRGLWAVRCQVNGRQAEVLLFRPKLKSDAKNQYNEWMENQSRAHKRGRMQMKNLVTVDEIEQNATQHFYSWDSETLAHCAKGMAIGEVDMDLFQQEERNSEEH